MAAKLSLAEVTSDQLADLPCKDGRLVFCTDTGDLYRDTSTDRVLLSSNVVAATVDEKDDGCSLDITIK